MRRTLHGVHVGVRWHCGHKLAGLTSCAVQMRNVRLGAHGCVLACATLMAVLLQVHMGPWVDLLIGLLKQWGLRAATMPRNCAVIGRIELEGKTARMQTVRRAEGHT